MPARSKTIGLESQEFQRGWRAGYAKGYAAGIKAKKVYSLHVQIARLHMTIANLEEELNVKNAPKF